MVIDYRFYDTCSLLLKTDSLFEEKNKPFAISSITLEELENIKTSKNKDADIKYTARKLLHLLNEHIGEYDVHIYTEDMIKPIEEKHLPVTNDTRILATAFDYDNNVHPDETIFVTNDLSLKAMANLFFGDGIIESVEEDYDDDYTGYKNVIMDDKELEKFYTQQDNYLNLLTNQYLIIRNVDGEIIDRKVWTGTEYRNIYYKDFDSQQLGVISPIKGDIQQQFFADSLFHNKITLVRGPAGSGKSLLSLGFLFNQLERHRIEKIIIFCNTVAAKNAAKLGYYPGDKITKLLDSQIGNFLSSKLGSRMEVERLINDEKIILLPTSDARGYDSSGMHAGIYITEAQNLDIPLMKLLLERIGEDSICIIDGDNNQQVDMDEYAGLNNGMRRASKIFRGESIYGEIELQQVHRSKIAMIATKM